MKKSLLKTENGVTINFVGTVAKQNIVKMVQNCSSGACECMSEGTKAKIKNMQVAGNDGDVTLALEGDLCIAEIEEALAKSKVLK